MINGRVHTLWAKYPDDNTLLVSIDGGIYRRKQSILCRDGKVKNLSAKYLSVSIHKHGYTQIGLNNKPKKVANLVAETFLIINKSEINCQVLHKNDIKYDSRVENLYYGSYEDNIADSIRNGNRVYKVHENCDKAKWKKLRVYGKGLDKVFPNIKEACAFIGVSASAISQALKNKRKTGGYNVELQAE